MKRIQGGRAAVAHAAAETASELVQDIGHGTFVRNAGHHAGITIRTRRFRLSFFVNVWFSGYCSSISLGTSGPYKALAFRLVMTL